MFTQITRLASRGTVLSAAVVTIALGAGEPATAAGDFGEHVSTCAQTIGFSADHNPGMHQGFHGWDPTHTC
jgi:hypothetical protein